ncbi:MAG: 16S rRNA (cytidine(1402)-2'-O)-methyltransferase [Deltaproteobacteria bacterium]|nr:16S rRNA (cytidine(1402)-2'-O)-methyltransferase [Deltaproteobacteria bacterium]
MARDRAGTGQKHHKARTGRGRSNGAQASSESFGILYVVATPIGNMEDLTMRAARILADVDLIASEDTRSIGRFLSRLGIANRQVSLFEGNEARRTDEMITDLIQGQDVALVCEAGTPTISDPGGRLVAAAVDRGIRVIPIPGPSAVVAAVSASGLATDHFYFEGFLPRKAGALRRRLEALSALEATLVFYESPRRTADSLSVMNEVFGGERRAVVARELTKVHEEFVRGTLDSLGQRFADEPPRGEVTILVAGAQTRLILDGEELDAQIRILLDEGLRPRAIAARLSPETELTSSELYRRVLASKEGDTRGGGEPDRDDGSESNGHGADDGPGPD